MARRQLLRDAAVQEARVRIRRKSSVERVGRAILLPLASLLEAGFGPPCRGPLRTRGGGEGVGPRVY